MTDDIYDKYDYNEDDISVAEYVGFPLYISIRNRLTDLGCPYELVNPIIVEAIDVHDLHVFNNGVNNSTIVVNTTNEYDIQIWVDEGVDEIE
jgi:hypothetical protein